MVIGGLTHGNMNNWHLTSFDAAFAGSSHQGHRTNRISRARPRAASENAGTWSHAALSSCRSTLPHVKDLPIQVGYTHFHINIIVG